MGVAHSLVTGVTILGVVGLIVFGIGSCTERQNALRETCMRQGGTVIEASHQGFHCIQNGKTTSHD